MTQKKILLHHQETKRQKRIRNQREPKSWPKQKIYMDTTKDKANKKKQKWTPTRKQLELVKSVGTAEKAVLKREKIRKHTKTVKIQCLEREKTQQKKL